MRPCWLLSESDHKKKLKYLRKQMSRRYTQDPLKRLACSQSRIFIWSAEVHNSMAGWSKDNKDQLITMIQKADSLWYYRQPVCQQIGQNKTLAQNVHATWQSVLVLAVCFVLDWFSDETRLHEETWHNTQFCRCKLFDIVLVCRKF